MRTIPYNGTFYSEKIGGTDTIEEILCLSTLIALGVLDKNSKLTDAKRYYENTINEDCGACCYIDSCLACIINE